jgi:hypothetical protein
MTRNIYVRHAGILSYTHLTDTFLSFCWLMANVQFNLKVLLPCELIVPSAVRLSFLHFSHFFTLSVFKFTSPRKTTNSPICSTNSRQFDLRDSMSANHQHVGTYDASLPTGMPILRRNSASTYTTSTCLLVKSELRYREVQSM